MSTQLPPLLSESPVDLLAGLPETDAAEPVLVIDDEPMVANAVAGALRRAGYAPISAGTAEAGLQLLQRHDVRLVFCDVNLPGASGLDLIPRALALDERLAIVMVSGRNDAETAASAVELGAVGYITKPFTQQQIQAAARRALRRWHKRAEEATVQRLLHDAVQAQRAALERERQQLHELFLGIVETLVNAMEAKDEYLRGHSQRVADLAAAIAVDLGLDDHVVDAVRTAAHLHDVGKIGIRPEVLGKPGACSDEEFAHIQTHVKIGVDILSPLRQLGDALQYIADHHEHFDGSGYPKRLAGEAISVGGRILAAADAFDALTSRRPYREPMLPDDALEYLAGEHVGTLLDPRVFAALRRVVRDRRVLPFL